MKPSSRRVHSCDEQTLQIYYKLEAAINNEDKNRMIQPIALLQARADRQMDSMFMLEEIIACTCVYDAIQYYDSATSHVNLISEHTITLGPRKL